MYSVQLNTLKQKVKSGCSTRTDGFPCKSGGDSGDMVLFNALLTFAEVEEARGYVPACIAEDGRPVRSPDLLLQPPQEDGFSKDMLLGVLLWTLVTRDPAPLDRLIGYINRTGCLCEKASDRRCTMTPQMTYLTNRVAKEVGCANRLKRDWMPGWLFAVLEIASALVTPLGYQCHLLSIKALIQTILGSGSVVSGILARRDSGNPWFLYLAGDRDRAALTLLSLNVQPGRSHQWSWERASEEKAWHDSMGWDIVFLCRLFEE